MDVRPLNGLIQHHQSQYHQPTVQNPNPHPPPPPFHAEAPPKQVATAMERLSEAARLISDIRMGADRLLEALFIVANPQHANKPVDLFRKEDASMRQYLLDLRSIGKQLEESGVLNESLRSRSNSWGLHLPVVCPDGAVVAYAWKRQLAGQAGASAVDRTRLALKAFGDQKRRFFPHLDDERVDGQSTDSSLKRPCLSRKVLKSTSQQEDVSECKTLVDVLARMEKEMPNVKVHTYERLGWSKRALSLPASDNETTLEDTKGVAFHGYGKLMTGVRDGVAIDKVSVLELLVPSVFRCVVSLHPAGSTEPDAVAFFSPDEGGSYIHARGVSVHHVFRQITEHAGVALQHFLGIGADTALYTLLHWICSYQTLLSKVCSKCGRLLAMDQRLSLLLPPVLRSYRYFSPIKASSKPQTTKERSADIPEAYHIGCLPENL